MVVLSDRSSRLVPVGFARISLYLSSSLPFLTLSFPLPLVENRVDTVPHPSSSPPGPSPPSHGLPRGPRNPGPAVAAAAHDLLSDCRARRFQHPSRTVLRFCLFSPRWWLSREDSRTRARGCSLGRDASLFSRVSRKPRRKRRVGECESSSRWWARGLTEGVTDNGKTKSETEKEKCKREKRDG